MKRRTKIVLGVAVGLLVALVLGGWLYLRSAHFHRFVLVRLIAQLENVTGGRVELRDHKANLRALEVQLDGLVIRGRETDPSRPFFAADNVFVRLKIASLFRREIYYRYLRVTRPRINVYFDQAGRSNIPEPKVKRTEGKGPLDKVWDLGINRLEVVDGELNWNDQRLPVQFVADEVLADLDYAPARDLFVGHLSFSTPLPPPSTASAAAGQPAAAQPAMPSQVRADLLLSRESLEMPRLTLQSPHSSLQASGRLHNFLEPKMVLNYEGRLDAAELAAAGRVEQLRSGQAHLRGTFNYDIAGKRLDASGDLRAEKIVLRLPNLQLGAINGTAKYRVTPNQVELPAFQLSVLGGRLRGQARAGDVGRTPDVVITAQAQGFSVPVLTRAMSTRDLPLTELRWAGSLSGDLRVKFEVAGPAGIRGLRVESAMKIQPPAVTPPGMVPVSGEGSMVYAPAGGGLEVRNLVLQTPGTQVSADGRLGTSVTSRQTNVKLSAAVRDLREWTPFVNALRPGKPPLPMELDGRAEFQGALTGSLRSPNIEGRVEAVDFRYDGTHWNRFAGYVAYSPEMVRVTNAELRREGSFARLNASAQLERGEFTDTSPFTLDGTVEHARIADVQALAGSSYPVTGQVDATVRAGGTRLNPQGGGFVQVTGGTLAGEPFDSLRANVIFTQGEVRANDILLKKGRSQIAGDAEYRWRDRSYRFQLTGSRVSLGEIQRLSSQRLAVSGLADFRASGAGTVDRPALDASLQVSDLVINGERAGNLSALVETRERLLTARLESKFLRGNINGKVTATLADDYPAQGRVDFQGIDPHPLLGNALRGRITTRSVATGFIDFSGPLKKPENLAARAELTDFRISIEQVDFRNDGPLRASYRNGLLQIDEAHVVGTDTDLRASGFVRLTGAPGGRTLNVRTEGQINLALVRTLDPDLLGSGRVVLNAAVTGTLQRPLFSGRAEFRNAAIAVQDFPTGLSELNGAVVFDGTRVRIENMTGEAGGGRLRLSGMIDDYTTGQPEFRLRAEADSVRLRYPEGTSSVLNGGLGLTGTPRGSTLSGEIVVGRARFDPRFDLARTLGLARNPTRAPVSSPLLNNMQLDVRITSAPNLQFETSQARNMQMEANLRLRGTAARPSVLGRINLLQGEIFFAGARYTVNRGDISFTDPVRIQPVLNLSLQTRAQQYEITIDLNGTLDQINVSYRSDPPLPSGDIQALLITGRAREGPANAQAVQSFPQIGANTILSQALNSAVSSRIERIFGVSRLKIDPQVGGPETNPGARVTLEQQVTPDVRFTYISNLAATQQQVIQVEWTINPRWSVIAVRDRNGLFGIDLKWRKRFR